MKRLALSLVLVFSLLSAPSMAAVKAGAKCTKVGQVKNVSVSQFKCVKKGKKLIWQKSKIIKQTAPQTIPNPAPSSTLSVNPQPSSSPLPTAISSSTPTPIQSQNLKRPSSFEDLDAKTSWRFVYDDLQKRLRANENELKPISYEYIYGATVNRTGAKLIQEINKKALAFFSDVYNPEKPIIEFYATELDEEDWRYILNRIDGNLNRWFYVTNGKRDPRAISGAAGKGYVLYMMGSQSIPRAEDFLLFAVHETAHIIQNHMTPNGASSRISHDSNGNVTFAEISLPLLFLEGHADFIGYNVGYPTADQSRLALQSRAPRSPTGVLEYPVRNVQDVVSFFENWEDPRYVYKRLPNGKYERDSYAIYYYGNIALTGLTAVKGYEPLHQFFIKVKSGIPYRKAFEESYDMTLSDFYRQIAPYVIQTVKELSNN